MISVGQKYDSQTDTYTSHNEKGLKLSTTKKKWDTKRKRPFTVLKAAQMPK